MYLHFLTEVICSAHVSPVWLAVVYPYAWKFQGSFNSFNNRILRDFLGFSQWFSCLKKVKF